MVSDIGGGGDEASTSADTTGDDNNKDKTNEINKPDRKRGRPAACKKKKTELTMTINKKIVSTAIGNGAHAIVGAAEDDDDDSTADYLDEENQERDRA